MWLLILEALGALVLLLFLVWWTMFAGRRRGERGDESAQPVRDDENRPPPGAR